jgi:hypothetical protein
LAGFADQHRQNRHQRLCQDPDLDAKGLMGLILILGILKKGETLLILFQTREEYSVRVALLGHGRGSFRG